MRVDGYALKRAGEVLDKWGMIPPLIEYGDELRVMGAQEGWTDGTFEVVAHSWDETDFYGVVDSEGNYVPYTPAELQSKLKDYSSEARLAVETGGQIINTTYGMLTTRDVRAIIDNHKTLFQIDDRHPPVTVKAHTIVSGKLSDNVAFLKLDHDGLMSLLNDMSEFTDSCFVREEQVATQIEAGEITTMEAVDAAYDDLRVPAQMEAALAREKKTASKTKPKRKK